MDDQLRHPTSNLQFLLLQHQIERHLVALAIGVFSSLVFTSQWIFGAATQRSSVFLLIATLGGALKWKLVGGYLPAIGKPFEVLVAHPRIGVFDTVGADIGAVAAAGGPMFPADTGSIELIRTDKQGQKVTVVADLDAIKKGTRPDLSIREGDVIEVSSSGPKLAAYGIYRFFTSIMSVGASIPIR